MSPVNVGMGSLRCLASYNMDLDDCQQSMVLAGGSSGDLLVYDSRTSRCVMSHKGHEDAILCLTPHEYRVWSGGDDRTVRQWDLRMNRQEHTYSTKDGSPKVHLCPAPLRLPALSKGTLEQMQNTVPQSV